MLKQVLGITAIALFTVGCTSSNSSHADDDVDAITKLRDYRSYHELCNSQSTECKLWSELALKCEQSLAGEIPTGRYCTSAETYREAVTGVERSTDPGAYSF